MMPFKYNPLTGLYFTRRPSIALSYPSPLSSYERNTRPFSKLIVEITSSYFEFLISVCQKTIRNTVAFVTGIKILTEDLYNSRNGVGRKISIVINEIRKTITKNFLWNIRSSNGRIC